MASSQEDHPPFIRFASFSIAELLFFFYGKPFSCFTMPTSLSIIPLHTCSVLHHTRAHAHMHAMPCISVPPWSLNCCDEAESWICLHQGEAACP